MSVLHDRVRQLLRDAVRAPSGDNVQPWRFRLVGNRLDILNTPDDDAGLYNINQRAWLLSHGALIESIAVSAHRHGLSVADVSLEGAVDGVRPAASLTLSESPGSADPLGEYVTQRCTNRKFYSGAPLSNADVQALASCTTTGRVRAALITDAPTIRTAAAFAGVNERVMLENREMHGYLFSMVRWNNEHAERTQDGFQIATFELNPVERIAFSTFRSWPIMTAAARVGMARVVGKSNAARYATSSALCGIAMRDRSPEHWLEAGRALQRVWLQATARGLAAHPLAGIPLLAERIRSGATHSFNPNHVQLVDSSYRGLSSLFQLSDETLAIMLRIGHAPTPSTRTVRRAPVFVDTPSS